MDAAPVKSPPTTFNLSDFTYRPNVSYQPRPGLRESTERLTEARRYRSALEPLLVILAESPRDQEALTLALIVIGHPRTQHVQADEALSMRYLLDRRLDPIFAVCSRCRTISWSPHNCLFDAATIANPVGLQCWTCGYVVCRKCYAGGITCPHCRAQGLRTLVYPTGRQPRQFERRSQPVVAAIVMREGPIPPDREWLVALLEMVSPDVLEDPVHLSAFPWHPWRGDVEGMVMAKAMQMILGGELGAARLDGAIGGEVEHDGLRAYILKLYA